jgi:hypothetical protein
MSINISKQLNQPMHPHRTNTFTIIQDPLFTICQAGVINKTYGHKTYYLMATKENPHLETRNAQQKRRGDLSTIPAPLNFSQKTSGADLTGEL